MSQRRPAPRPTSHHSSESPRSDAHPSPGLPQPAARVERQDVGIAITHDGSSFPLANGDRSLRIPPRPLGVQSLMNPTSPLSQSSTVSSSAPLPRPPHLPDLVPGSLAMAAGPHDAASAHRPYGHQGHAPPPLPSAHQTVSRPSPGTYAAVPYSSDRGSPTAGHPLPALNNPRHMLSPRAPRTTSLSRPPREMDLQSSTFPSSSLNRKRSFAESNLIPEGPPPPPPPPPLHPSNYGPHPSFGASPSSLGTRTPPPRSLSQPAMLSYLPPSDAPPQPPLPPGMGRDAQGRPAMLPGQASFVSLHPNRAPSLGPGEMPAMGTSGPGPMPLYRPGGQRPLIGHGGQHMIEISPASGEKILVPVDMHQASKASDDKRQRNAGASARFRQRKKEKEQEMDKEIQRLQDEKRELQGQMQDLQRQRDFYKDDRNRLRELVRRTPQISEQAYAGPPSPSPSRSGGGSFAESSPNAPAHIPPATTVQNFPETTSDTESIERHTARRRRTEPALEFTMPAYGSPASQSTPPVATALPPIPGPSTLGERLPPLRGMEGPLPGTMPRPPPTEHAFPPYSQPPFEPSWGGRPSGPPSSSGQPQPGRQPGPSDSPPEGYAPR